MVSHSGARIRAVRDLFAYTQVQLAELTGISQGQLSKIERGEVAFETDELRRVAHAVGVPITFLTADPVEMNVGSLRFRKAVRMAKRSDTKQVAQLVLETYRVCTHMATTQGLPPPSLPAATLESPSINEIEDLALQTRGALRLPDSGPVQHVTRACERAGIFVVPLHLPAGEPDAKALGHDGASTRRAFFDPGLIGYLPDSPGDRIRHTLAHELGHLVLHHPHPQRPASPGVEQEAHHFAGAFLMPKESAIEVFGMAQPLTLERLKIMKAGWGMAIQALIMRAWRVGIIDDDRRRSLYMQLSSRGWRKAEPVTVHAEQPLLLHKVLESRYGDPIDWTTAAEELGLPSALLRRLAPSPRGSNGTQVSGSDPRVDHH